MAADLIDPADSRMGSAGHELSVRALAAPVQPPRWRPIAESKRPDERKDAALQLWPADFKAMVPRFVEQLQTNLVDVRVVRTDAAATPVLEYVLCGSAGYATWLGQAPVEFDEPLLFEAFTAPIQNFLHHVHPGFSNWDGESHGPIAPWELQNFAEYLGHGEEGIPWWFACEWNQACMLPDSRRFLRVTGQRTDTSGDDAQLLISPNLPTGTAVICRNRELQLRPLAAALDEFMTAPLLAESRTAA